MKLLFNCIQIIPSFPNGKHNAPRCFFIVVINIHLNVPCFRDNNDVLDVELLRHWMCSEAHFTWHYIRAYFWPCECYTCPCRLYTSHNKLILSSERGPKLDSYFNSECNKTKGMHGAGLGAPRSVFYYSVSCAFGNPL